jgi:gliding motility-associated-like protein
MKNLTKRIMRVEDFWGWMVISALMLGVLMMQSCYADQNLMSTYPEQDEIGVKYTFSPDGDGVNDTWKPTTQQDWDKYFVEVSDRYGNTIWWSTDPSEEYTGKIGGSAILDPFVFFIIFAKENGRKYYKEGIVVNELYIDETY